MKKETAMNEIRNIALMFLDEPVQECEEVPFLVIHPFFEYRQYDIPNNEKMQSLDIVQDKDALRLVRNKMEIRIMQSDLSRIMALMRKAFRLTFFRYANEFMGEEDFAKALADAYTISENPNQDVNVSIPQLKKWFRRAKKEALMTQKELERYTNLPDALTVYRGIGPNGIKQGISWTDNLETAIWFAKRFSRYGDAEKRTVLKAEIHKEEVYACFDGRNEHEIVCQPKCYAELAF